MSIASKAFGDALSFCSCITLFHNGKQFCVWPDKREGEAQGMYCFNGSNTSDIPGSIAYLRDYPKNQKIRDIYETQHGSFVECTWKNIKNGKTYSNMGAYNKWAIWLGPKDGISEHEDCIVFPNFQRLQQIIHFDEVTESGSKRKFDPSQIAALQEALASAGQIVSSLIDP